MAVIALPMGIPMPPLARVPVIAGRMTCGSHSSGVGKSMLMYASDYHNSYPVGGLMNSTWSPLGHIAKWDAKLQKDAFAGNRATVTASFYMLVRYSECTPKSSFAQEIGTQRNSN